MEKKRNLNELTNTLKRRLKAFFESSPDKILKKVKGVIHVGANTGQEIPLYAKFGLSVVWIEPIPDVFEKLQSNLIGINGQIAVKGLATDVDNMEYQFHLASNNGASSSILDLNLHQDIWP